PALASTTLFGSGLPGDARGHGIRRGLRAGAAAALTEEGPPVRRLHGEHPLSEFRRGAGSVRADDRDDLDRREGQARIIPGDSRVVPPSYLEGEDSRDHWAREPQVGNPLPADLEVVHERGAPAPLRHIISAPFTCHRVLT